MKKLIYIFFVLYSFSNSSQTLTFKGASKWGIKQNEKFIIEPVYDTIFNFDNTGKVCLACHKIKSTGTNKFIKVASTTFVCNYINFDKKILTIKTELNDTSSIFNLSKTSVKELNDNKNYFIATCKNKKYLIDKNFRQITFNGYYSIGLSDNPDFLIVEQKEESGQIYTGLVNLKEEKIIDFNYSGIKVNAFDSLIIGCTSGIKVGADDDVLDYSGKKLYNFKRHIDFATKSFIIHKIFEPSEYYVIYNLITKEEKILNASDVKQYSTNEILVKLKNNWFIYNFFSEEKRPYNIR